tara:strand:+ start:2613 stop:2939 length:327 start_codon:yes stop_codon:yes gene_type:complete
MKIKNIFIIFILSILLLSCQTTKDALQGKKRSNTNEEFLVKKKQPLTVPPDINKLPVPSSENQEQTEIAEDESEVKEILDITGVDQSNENSSENSTSLEQSILKKINN